MAAGIKKGSVEDQIVTVLRKHPEGTSDEVLSRELAGSSVQERAEAINALLGHHMLTMLVDAGGMPIYKLHDVGEAVKFKGLGAEEMLIYQVIKASGNLGIWTRDMKQKTNLAQPKINKILKVLEERALVKHVKSVQNASRKVYMLSELEPAKEITGGPWYGPDSFDTEFIDVLREAVHSRIRAQGELTLDEITGFIAGTGISRQALQPDDMLAIVHTLVLDGKLEDFEREDGEVVWRPAMVPVPESIPFSTIPCGTCPVIGDCVDGGPISPETCKYYQRWLSDSGADW